MSPLAVDLAAPALSGLVAGWGVAIPLGAIGVLLVDLGMRAGLRRAAAAAAAVATADLLYAGVAAVAGSAAAGLLAPHERALHLAAAAVLAAVAVLSLRGVRRRSAAASGAVPPPGRLYARFLGLTAVNPTTVVYFAALIAGLPAVATAPAGAKAVFVAAVGLASLSWQLVLAGAGAALHHRLPAGARLWTALAGNALVLGLAARMALSA
jgi:threonine/homoserine/homoserine lactone efflux protein